LNNKIRSKLDIPAIVINFKKIGENIDQVREQLRTFMEMFK